MTTATLGRPRRFWQTAAAALIAAVAIAVPVLKTQARPLVRHLREHAYGIFGLAFIDSAAFVHSPFAGLLVTGVSFLLFEWKVSE